MVEETSFPRGGHSIEAKSKKATKRNTDFLFGAKDEAKSTSNPKKKPKTTDKIQSKKSLLPLGGGAVIKPAKGEMYIESLGFTKLAKGFRLLACVKEVHEDLAIFSLPNQWTGFMLRNEDEPPCDVALSLGQFLPVEIVKAVQESTKSGPRRRIQVTCSPAVLNPKDTSIHHSGLPVRGIIKSIEDHGILVDLGLKRRGFLRFDDIQQDYTLNSDSDTDKVRLVEGRLLDFLVKDSKTDDKVLKLALPSAKEFAKHLLPNTHTPTLSNLRPGMLVHAVVEEIAKNGLCVSFAGGAFRGAIEHQHLGAYYIPEDRNESNEWKKLFDTHRSLTARIIAVDPSTKTIRLSLLSHVLELMTPVVGAPVGALVERAKVIRLDPGLGALLALPTKRPEDTKPLFKPISDNEDYLRAAAVQTVYVHISKAMDEKSAGRVEDVDFSKKFAPSTEHSVRILSTSNHIEGILAGATAETLVNAQVLTHADLVPGKVYKQVPIVSHLKNGGVMVEFGMGVRGIIPSVQLFDQVAKSEFRERVLRTKFAVGSKVDVRVLTVDEDHKKCILTAKKSLVKAKNIIKAYEDADVGTEATGFVSKIDDNGIFVTFFNGVFARASARSLSVDLGVIDHKENFSVGDSVRCCIIHKKKRSTKKRLATDEMETSDDDRLHWELTVSLRPNVGDQSISQDELAIASSDEIASVAPGTVLPERSLRIVALVNGKEKKRHFVPGYAIVSIKTKYLFPQSKLSKALPQIECKLPYDQLADTFTDVDLTNAAALDSFAHKTLEVGKKINRKAIVLRDPQKSQSEYFTGLGKLIQVSIRPSFISNSEATESAPVIPDNDTSLAIGESLMGYVAQIDSRYGSFVRFYNGVTGLIPKSHGGFTPQLFSTMTVQVAGIDESKKPRQIMLKMKTIENGSVDRPSIGVKQGDRVGEARIEDISFHRMTLKPIETSVSHGPETKFRLHCTKIDRNMNKTPSKEKKDYSQQEMSKFHPFHGLRVGDIVSDLAVFDVSQTRKSTLVELSQIDEAKYGREAGLVRGVISSHTENGAFVLIGPDETAFLPRIEMSTKREVVENAPSYFPVGSCFELSVLSKERQGKGGKKVLQLSLIPHQQHTPEVGQKVLGRINRRLRSILPPSLMIDLPCGKISRCCITELTDKDQWANMPLTSGKESEGSRPPKEDTRYADGNLVDCIVIGEPQNASDCVEVSLRKSRLQSSRIEESVPQKGDCVQAYVISTTKKGCFLRITKDVEGRVLLKDLSDSFLPNPAAVFPPGRLVAGLVSGTHQGRSASGKTILDMDLRESSLSKARGTGDEFEEIKVGEKYTGRVTSIEDYGVFVCLDKSGISGLVHKSECSDRFVKNVADLYEPGDLVKVLVLKKDNEKKRLGFSMKGSHFDGEDKMSDSDSESSAQAMEVDSDDDSGKDSLDSDDENFVSKLADKSTHDGSSDGESSSDDSSTSSSEHEDGANPIAIDAELGFDWSGDLLQKSGKDDASSSDESNSEDSEEDANGHTSRHSSRRKHAQKRKEEEEIGQRESALADGTADENPETSSDFERLLASEPNSSELWIRYMAFYLSLANIQAAREVAERAFEKIDLREEVERLNVWSALMALELKYGTEESLEGTLARACQHNNPKHSHLRLCELLAKEAESSPSVEIRAEDMFARTCKKFKGKKSVWFARLEFLLKNGRSDEALALSKRALQSLPTYKHLPTLTKFAQLLYEYDSPERARTVFDGLISKNKKRLDLFFVYVDKETKHGDIKVARSLLQRAAASRKAVDDSLLKLSDKQMKSLFKKWYSFEEDHGNDEHREAVKLAAKTYVEQN